MSVNTYTPDSTRIIHNTSVDFVNRYINTPVHLVQYDNTSPIIAVKLYSSGTPYAVPAGYDVNIRLKKPDKTIIYNPVLGCSADRTEIYIEATTQMCAAAGDTYPVIEVQNGGNIAASGSIYIAIDENPVNDENIQSSSEAKAIKDFVDLAKSWAIGETGARVGEDTDNSKYYAGQSAFHASNSRLAADEALTYANAADASANDAATSEANALASANAADTSANLASAHATSAANSASSALVSERNADTSATNAATSETNAADSAIEAESWAVGGTGTRAGEDTNNAEFWAKQAQAVSGLHIATTSIPGIVKPDGDTITVEPDGTIHGTGAGDDVTIVKNPDGKLAVPIDGKTIYIGGDGKMKAAGGGGAANIEDITKADYDQRLKDGTLDHDKYYAIVDDTEEGGGGDGKGIIPITKADYEALKQSDPDYMLGKTFQIIDDYDDPQYATYSEFGFVKLCSDPGVSGNGLALPTSEKDENLPGTLANRIKMAENELVELNNNKRNAEIEMLPVATDINTVTKTGDYFTINATNLPIADNNNGYLIVKSFDSDTLVQLYIPYHTNEIYQRMCVFGIWGAWAKISKIVNITPNITSSLNGWINATYYEENFTVIIDGYFVDAGVSGIGNGGIEFTLPQGYTIPAGSGLVGHYIGSGNVVGIDGTLCQAFPKISAENKIQIFYEKAVNAKSISVHIMYKII